MRLHFSLSALDGFPDSNTVGMYVSADDCLLILPDFRINPQP